MAHEFVVSSFGQLCCELVHLPTCEYLCTKDLSVKSAEDCNAVDLTSDTLLSVKSLVWQYEAPLSNGYSISYSNNGSNRSELYALVVLDSRKYVDPLKLKQALGISDEIKCILASKSKAEELSGCKIGTIPAVPWNIPMLVVVDQDLILESTKHDGYIYSSSGLPDYHLKIKLDTFIQHYCESHMASQYQKYAKSVESISDSGLKVFSVSCEMPVRSDQVNECASDSSSKPSSSQDTARSNKIKPITSFPYSTLRRLAATNETDKFMQILEIYDSLNNEVNPLDIDSPTTSGKTALQLAAWKGPISHILALIDRGADINKWSTNIGNYGKTAIFYAITRCRDDVVMYLIENGAWVKLVNNKGQSPRSLAVSHLKPETLEAIERAETQQSNLPWLNFRATHSDGGLFGDLDPRFLEESTLKYVLTQTQHFNDSHIIESEKSLKLSGEENIYSIEHKTQLIRSMKSVFPTTFEMRFSNQRRFIEENDKFHTLSDEINPSSISNVKIDYDIPQLQVLDELELLDRNFQNPIIPSQCDTVSESKLLVERSDIITIYGTILSKRHVGRLLVFANLIPYSNDSNYLESSIFNYSSVSDNKMTKLSWHVKNKQSGEIITNTPISIQLLVGKTMFQYRGEEVTRTICRCIAPGQTVKIIGKFSAIDDTESAFIQRLKYGNTSLDFSVIDYKIIENLALPENSYQAMNDEDGVECQAPSKSSKKNKKEVTPTVLSNDKPLVSQTHEIHENVKEKQYHRLFAEKLYNISCSSQNQDITNHTITAKEIHLVDSIDSIQVFNQSLINVLEEFGSTSEDVIVGLDCEWRPQRSAGVDYPVSILQLAVHDIVYVVDLLTINSLNSQDWESDVNSWNVSTENNSPCLNSATPSENQSSSCELLDQALLLLFRHPKVIVLGFGINGDLRKLNHSYPKFRSFESFSRCLDLQSVITKLKLLNAKRQSLSKLSDELFGYYLDKTEQCSEWHVRPLSWRQICYAALDAIVLLRIYSQLHLTCANITSDSHELCVRKIKSSIYS